MKKVKYAFNGKTKDAIIAELELMDALEMLEVTDFSGKVYDSTVGDLLTALNKKLDTPIISGAVPQPGVPNPGVAVTDALRTAMVLPRKESILCTVGKLSSVLPGKPRTDGTVGNPFVILTYIDKDGAEKTLALSTKKNDGTDNPMFIDNMGLFAAGTKLSLTTETAIKNKTQYEKNGFIFTHGGDNVSMSAVRGATDDEGRLISAKINTQIDEIQLDAFEARLGKIADSGMRTAMATIMAAKAK